MTDRPANPAPASKRRNRGVLGVLWASAAIFMAVLALLATRLASGRDPALRAHAPAPVPHRVLIRRVYERRVIIHLPPSAPAQPTRASQQVSSAGESAPSLPVTRTS